MSEDDGLLAKLLAIPTSSHKPKRQAQERDFTSRIEVSDSSVNLVINDDVGVVNEGTALAYLEQEALNPTEWEVASFKKSQWGDPDNLKESVSFTFKRVSAIAGEAQDSGVDELVAYLDKHKHVASAMDHSHTSDMVVAIGDMQFGKYENPTEECWKRAVACIDRAAELAHFNGVQHLHVAWLGDHIEGFVSQGGANVWRTQLPLMEQTRLVRRLMTYAMKKLRPECRRLTMAAVPGNHGEPQRFSGKGVTRYDDSHDTEALVAVAEAAELSTDYKDVEFFLPETDEMTVLLEVGGVNFAHVHGHQYRPNKHFDWWKGQAFNQDSAMHMADVLLAGHLHHGHIEEDGKRLYVGAPALEAESVWFKNATGTGGNPGIFALVVEGKAVTQINMIRGDE